MEDIRLLDIRDIMRELQGDMTGEAFAGMLGISTTTIYWIYGGKRRVGRMTVERMMALWPERREELQEAFFAQGHNSPRAETDTP